MHHMLQQRACQPEAHSLLRSAENRPQNIHITSLARLLRAQCLVTIDVMEFQPFKSMIESCEVVQVVPPHGVDICLSNFFCENWVMPSKEAIYVSVPGEGLTMDNL